MGEILAFPRRQAGHREGCACWLRDQSAITLNARPACAALAMALASTAPSPSACATSPGPRGVQPSATILPMIAMR